MIGRTLSHFRILAKLGEGGMGVVYRAEDVKLHRPVALKVLPPQLVGNEERRLRFLREARAAAAVSHPNIATIYEVGEADGIVFIAMELVEGQTLRALMGDRSLPIKDALRIATEIAEGLAQAHQAHVIHRDLKPDNVIVGMDGRARILDFGLAKLLEKQTLAGQEGTSPTAGADPGALETISREMTREGRIFGTAAYMSPEQARGQPLDARSDIFSFGTTLYEIVTGKVPFHGRTSTDILSAIVRDEPTPPGRVNPEVPQELERIIGKCLEKEPRERYQHTDDLAVDLRKLKRVTDSGVRVVRETGAPPRRRRRGPILVVAALAAAAVIGVGFFLATRPGPRPLPALTQKQLTANPVGMDVYDAAISPEGKYLAYTDASGLHLQIVESGETHPLALPEGLRAKEIAWYPDGSRLLLTGVHASSATSTVNQALWSISVLGGAPRKLQDDAWRAAVSPDGAHIAFLGLRAGWPPREIWMIGPDGEQPRRLVSIQQGKSFWWAGWSPDSRRVVYGVMSASAGSLPVAVESLDRNGGEPVVLISDSRILQDWLGVLNARWLPDGRLVYARAEPAPRRADSNLWEMSIDPRTGKPAGEPRRLTDWAGYSVRHLSVTADGRRLAFLKHRQQPDVYVGEFEHDSRRLKSSSRQTHDERDDYPTAWARDGQAVLFQSNRRGNVDMFTQRVGESTAEAIVASPGDESEARLSPDGAFILYWLSPPSGSEEGAAQTFPLMRSPLAGGSPEQVLEADADAQFRCAAARGGRCVLGAFSGNQIVFTEFDPEGGRGVELGKVEFDPSAFCNWDLSPDGSRIAVVNFGNQVRILTLPGGTVRDLSAGAWGGMEFVAWTADGRGVIVNGGGITQYVGLLYIGLDGRREMVWQRENEWPVYPVPSPDGRRLAYASMISESNAWMIENF